MNERTLVTGGLGCIGAWILKTLLEEGCSPVAFDVATQSHRLGLILRPDERAEIEFVVGDIADRAALDEALRNHKITRVIHLAALQVPFARANPPLGALVNVLGTVNLFEAVKGRRDHVSHVVYASSVAVFGQAVDKSPTRGTGSSGPMTHYGVYKQANEGNARVYWSDDGLPSIGLRPFVIYGVGRDQGLTSSPTKAMLAAALGREHHIEYGGRSQLQYAPDAARAFIAASRADVRGAPVHNLRGAPVHMSDVVSAIESAAPDVSGKITFDDVPLPFPEELESEGLESLVGALPQTQLNDGVLETVKMFRSLHQEGRLLVEEG